MKLTNNYILKKIGPTYSLIPLKGEGVCLDRILNLNDTALEIYNGIKDGLSIDEISLNISKKFNANLDDIKKDVLDFVNVLIKRGIVEDEN